MNFVSHARLFDQPDPRRIDLRASLSDIRGDWLVKTHLQRSSINIAAIVDVSASMHFGKPKKLIATAQFLNSLGRSASGYGDSVSLLAFDSTFRNDLFMPSQKGRGLGANMASQIENLQSDKATTSQTSALLECAEHAASGPGIVFLVSDFHTSLDSIEAALRKLDAIALVVPIIIWANAEVTPPDAGYLLPAQDLGSGSVHHLWLNKKTRTQWQRKVLQRREQLTTLFNAHESSPFFFTGSFNASDLSRYFMEQIA